MTPSIRKSWFEQSSELDQGVTVSQELIQLPFLPKLPTGQFRKSGQVGQMDQSLILIKHVGRPQWNKELVHSLRVTRRRCFPALPDLATAHRENRTIEAAATPRQWNLHSSKHDYTNGLPTLVLFTVVRVEKTCLCQKVTWALKLQNMILFGAEGSNFFYSRLP